MLGVSVCEVEELSAGDGGATDSYLHGLALYNEFVYDNLEGKRAA